jgi:hypothetical protein
MRFRHSFFIKIDQLIVSKDHRGAVLQYPVIGESFDDQLRANAIDIATGYAKNRFVHTGKNTIMVNRNSSWAIDICRIGQGF